jgi:hypothetical protein
MSRLAVLVALAIAPIAAGAQSSALVGAWAVSLPVGISNENGVVTPVMGTGTLNVTQTADSLIAILAVTPPAGMPARPPARMAARLSDASAVFVLTRQATITMNGETSTRATVSTFTLSAKGDALSGTVARKVEGIDDMPDTPQPLTGTRKKA